MQEIRPLKDTKSSATPQRVTIADLARQLGLTKSTISRALNDYPDIAERTRRRVKAAARKTGYRPHSYAQAIRTGRVRALGLVLQTDEHDGHAPFLTDFLSGVCAGASKVGWSLTVATAGSDAETQDVLSRLVAERKADGFILPRTLVRDRRAATLHSMNVPHILYGRTGHGRSNGDAKHSWYDVAGEVSMQDAALRLASLGHQRIGFVGGAKRYNFSRLRLDGFRSGMEKAGLHPDPAQIVSDAITRDDGAAATTRLLDQCVPPTAIIFATDEMALGAYRAAQNLGLTLGQHLSVISYDGIPAGRHMQPGLTSYHVNAHRAGGRLADLLIRQIRGEDPSTLRELAQAKLVARGSDGPPLLSPAELAQMIRNRAQITS